MTSEPSTGRFPSKDGARSCSSSPGRMAPEAKRPRVETEPLQEGAVKFQASGTTVVSCGKWRIFMKIKD